MFNAGNQCPLWLSIQLQKLKINCMHFSMILISCLQLAKILIKFELFHIVIIFVMWVFGSKGHNYIEHLNFYFYSQGKELL